MKNSKQEEMFGKVCEQVDKKITALTNEGIQQTNIDYLGKLVDIKKDISKMKKMETEEDNMMYRGNRNYGRNSYGNFDNYSGYGNYMESGNYGRRGYDTKYRGHDHINDMYESYGTYMGNKENGRYGSPETSRALDYMLKSLEEFVMALKNDATSQEEIEKIRKTARRIVENV